MEEKLHTNVARRRRRMGVAGLLAVATVFAGLTIQSVTAQADPPATGTWEDASLETAWITPNWPGYTYTTAYMKDADGWVHLRGLLRAAEVPV